MSQRTRPRRILALRGVVFQYDRRDALAEWLIHPFEQLDRRLAGLRPRWPRRTGLAVHVGLHLLVEQGGQAREVVAEQLFGTTPGEILQNLLRDGLHWTPLPELARRDHGGWHVTVPPEAFRFVDEGAVGEAVARLEGIEGRPFLVEDCVRFVERAFGGRRLFADSPALKLLGLDVGVADPALPLLRPDARLAPPAARYLRAAALRTLPDARGRAERVSAARRAALGVLALLAVAAGIACARRRARPRLPARSPAFTATFLRPA